MSAPRRPARRSVSPAARRVPSGLAVRLAAAFAIVAVGTAVAVAIAAPPIVGRGFAAMMAQQGAGTPGASIVPGSGMGGGMGGGMGQGQGHGNGPGNGNGAGAGMGAGQGAYLAEAQAETTRTIILVAALAALVASAIGVLIARRVARPLERLEQVAASVAAGDLAARSGIADRTDELGSLGRSFDAMAEDLERGEASRRRFFADAAHEMKTPLAVIEATAAAVMDGVYAHDDRHLATIREQARLLGRVVDDLRMVSLAESGALPLTPVDVRPADAVDATVRSFAARAETAGVTLAAETDAAVALVVRTDRDRLAQALGAFLDNALRYAPAGSRVLVRAEPAPAAPRRVRLSVLDEGPGVPETDLPHVFDRFYQADAARDRGTGTSGLGLAIVRALAEAQGGTVGAANRPGGGATFWLELPAGDGAA